jgi:hypothetical protein
MQKFILMCLGLSLCFRLHASTPLTCIDHLVSAPLAQQVARAIEPGWRENSPTSIIDLYLALKKEERRALAKPPSKEMFQFLFTNTSTHPYRLEGLSPIEIKQFYLNSLRGLYIRAAAEWSEAEVRSQLGQKASRRLLRMGARILASFFSPYGLTDRELTPERALEFFASRKWDQYPWKPILSVIEIWLKLGPSATQEQFDQVWDQHATELHLRHADYERARLALNKGDVDRICCQTEPGCRRCPHNRAYLRDRKGD